MRAFLQVNSASSQSCLISGCLLIIFLQTCVGYNLETRLPLFKYGPSGSNFGFSVAQHRFSPDDSTGVEDTMLIAGAPTADALRTQPDTTKPGGVFYCPVSTDPTDCTRVMMDAGGSSSADIKTNQWLGVSLKSQGPGKMLVSCAHRWTQHFRLNTEFETERVCGKCFLLNATSNARIVEVSPDDPSVSPGFVSSPCNKVSNLLDSKRQYGYMQAGTSLYLHDDQYLLGAPGSWSWTGAMFDISMPEEVGTGLGAIFNQGENTMYSTPTCLPSEIGARGVKCNKIPLRRDSYMGFAVASSNAVATDSTETFYAAGAPRGNNTGAVVVFRKVTSRDGETVLEDLPYETVLGKDMTSSFGFSVAFADLDGNGLDELIVGAPQYYQYDNEGKYGGAVYVYQNLDNKGFGEVVPIEFLGSLDSFFGYSVAAIGDIDQDGYNDFAVGAPYERENGTVHIFRGDKDMKIKRSQVIRGKDFLHVRESGNGDIEGFGASLSGIIDADSNQYPDLLIGSLSDHISLFRTRPIIKVTMSLEVKQKELDLNSKTCPHDGTDHTCFDVKFCFKYKARHREYTQNLKLKYKLTLDSKHVKGKKSSRVHFDSPDGASVVKEKVTIPKAGKEYCPGNSHQAFFDGTTLDKLSPIQVDFEFDLDSDDVEREAMGEAVFEMINDPILDADVDRMKNKEVRIKNSCGIDGCQSRLSVDASMPEEIIVGEDAEAVLTVDVSNDGEEAHQANVVINIPANVVYNGFTVPRPSGAEIVCYTPSSGESTINCNLGNPYNKGSRDVIKIKLGMASLTHKDKSIDIQVSTSTTSENPPVPPVLLHSQIIIELDISLTATAQPEQVRYSEIPILGESAMETTKDIGPLVEYTFIIKNEASAPADGVELHIKYPYEIGNGKWLMYLVSYDVSSGAGGVTGTCSDDNVNELKLTTGVRGQRKKRSPQGTIAVAGPVARQSSSGGSYSAATLSCSKGARCFDLKCQVDEIPAGLTTSVRLLSRVWEATFLEEYSDIDLVYIEASANVTSSEENVRFRGDKTSKTIQTTVDHEFFKSDIASTFPWWYILIGVVLLLAIYIIIIFLLIKCGFFKRKRYPDNDENEVHEVHAEKERAAESNL